ncbi:regulatory protein RecX [Undibacterium arcticum]|uniref:Regulatory protein RecX n=1 Tax=Undibacterium arcticum TaxID=1762892 RepID=A0ABV7F5V8_9BURK
MAAQPAHLRQKLLQRGYGLEEVDPAIAFLAEHQFQSDVRYAGMKSRSVQHLAGDRKIALVLKGKGIAAELAAEQIETLPAEEGRAVGAAHRFRRQIEADGLTQALKVKIYRYLATRGFSAKSIKTAIIAIQQPE